MPNQYDFRARVAVLEWHDGDSFYGVLDQGCGIFRGRGMTVNSTILKVELEDIMHRSALIQAPELTKNRLPHQAGIDAYLYASQLAPAGVYPCITYKEDDNFDRPLVDLILPDGRLFSQAMLSAGHAVPYKT